MLPGRTARRARQVQLTFLRKGIWRYAQTEEGQHTFKNIRLLRERFEPEVVAKEKASRPPRAKFVKAVYRARAIDASWQMPLQQ